MATRKVFVPPLSVAVLLALAAKTPAPYILVDLTPANFADSTGTSAAGSQQTGYGTFIDINNGNTIHALLWSGTAAGVVDLNPSGYLASVANATSGTAQVGYGYTLANANNHA